MEATVQADPYSMLLRAIGYSVGGELLVSRVKALVQLYAEKREINSITWNELVDGFGRKTESKSGKKSAAQHMADMYSSLGLLAKYGNQLFPGPALDALSILRREFISDGDKFDNALRAVLCFQLLERDGDIFVNCLAASFDKRKCETFLNEMLSGKRYAIATVIRSPDLLKRVLEKVSIRNLDFSSKTSTSPITSPFARRTTPLMGGVVVEECISKDYLKKSPARRRRWAEDIGLCSKNGRPQITEYGKRFLEQLSEAGLMLANGGFAIWPYEPDLLRLRIFPSDIGVPKLQPWQFYELVAGTFARRSNAIVNDDDLDRTYEFLIRCKASYSAGNRVKGSIRHQIPIDIVQSCLLGLACAEERSIDNLPACLEAENKGKRRRFSRTSIRGREGAIEVKTKKDIVG